MRSSGRIPRRTRSQTTTNTMIVMPLLMEISKSSSVRSVLLTPSTGTAATTDRCRWPHRGHVGAICVVRARTIDGDLLAGIGCDP